MDQDGVSSGHLNHYTSTVSRGVTPSTLLIRSIVNLYNETFYGSGVVNQDINEVLNIIKTKGSIDRPT